MGVLDLADGLLFSLIGIGVSCGVLFSLRLFDIILSWWERNKK